MKTFLKTTFVFLHVPPCALSLVIVQLVKKTWFNDKFSFLQVLCSNLSIKNNARILSAIPLICVLLKIKECGIRSVIGHIIVVVTE